MNLLLKKKKPHTHTDEKGPAGKGEKEGRREENKQDQPRRWPLPSGDLAHGGGTGDACWVLLTASRTGL